MNNELRELRSAPKGFGTQLRHSEILRRHEHLFFVIGSRNSSNSVRLVEVAKKSGCSNSQLIHSESKIPFDLIKNSNTIGISSGASAPQILVDNFINELKNRFTVNIDEVEIIKEDIVFKIPKKLN